MPDSDFRLVSDWNPEAKRLTLSLVNRGREPLSGFRLAFTSLLRIKGADLVEGGTLVEQLSNSHVLAPPDGFVLAPGASWMVTADKVSHDLRHYTYGPKTAWLILADGRRVPVEPTPMTRGGIPGTPSPALAPTGPLPPGAPPVAVIPHPRSVGVEGARDLPPAITIGGGPAEARAAFDAVAALAARLFPGEPPLLAEGGIACRAETDAGLPPEAYRLQFDRDGVRLAASRGRRLPLRVDHAGPEFSAAPGSARGRSSSRSSASSTMRRASPSVARISTSPGNSIRRTRSRGSSTASPGTS